VAETPSPTRARILAIGIGCVLAGAGVWAWTRTATKHEATVYEQKSRAVRELIARHAHEPASPAPARRYELPNEVASILFPYGATEEYDPWSYYRHKGNQRIRLPLAERPGASFECVTNSLGMREDTEVAAEHPGLRVLVTGDSHTDGVCENRESYANRLEAALALDRPGTTVEVLNAANGGFSLYNYLGVLEKFVDLQPDAFVVGVYGGNDFREVLFPLAYFSRTEIENDTPKELAELERGRQLDARAMNQAFRSIVSGRAHPEQRERAVRAAIDLTVEMQAICRDHSIRMLCVYIPSPTEVAWKDHAEVFDRFKTDLSLSDTDLGRESEMAGEYLAGLRAADIETLDARDVLVPGEGPYFWKGEYHLNLRGHERIADALHARFATWKDSPPRREPR
jgi:lysophospholipase L1-like esterase